VESPRSRSQIRELEELGATVALESAVAEPLGELAAGRAAAELELPRAIASGDEAQGDVEVAERRRLEVGNAVAIEDDARGCFEPGDAGGVGGCRRRGGRAPHRGEGPFLVARPLGAAPAEDGKEQGDDHADGRRDPRRAPHEAILCHRLGPSSRMQSRTPADGPWTGTRGPERSRL